MKSATATAMVAAGAGTPADARTPAAGGLPAAGVANKRATPRGGRKPAAETNLPPLTRRLVDVDKVDVADERLRAVDLAWVDVLATSLGEVGQLQPIRVVAEPDGRLVIDGFGFGVHRLHAARMMGWQQIEADVALRGDVAESARSHLPEVFENLIRNDLTALDRAVFLDRYKAIHETLYPETRKGGDRRSAVAKTARQDQSETRSFRSEAAEKTGLSARAIEIAVAISRGLDEAAKLRLRGTWLEDHQNGLRLLSEQDAERQHRVLDLLFSAQPPEAGSVADALVLLDGRRLRSPAEKMYAATLGNWTRMNERQRGDFLDLHEEQVRAHARKRGWF